MKRDVSGKWDCIVVCENLSIDMSMLGCLDAAEVLLLHDPGVFSACLACVVPLLRAGGREEHHRGV